MLILTSKLFSGRTTNAWCPFYWTNSGGTRLRWKERDRTNLTLDPDPSQDSSHLARCQGDPQVTVRWSQVSPS